MPIFQTHTFAVLELSPAAYKEIETKLKSAGYDHCFVETEERTVIDMQGIAVTPKPKTE